MKKDAAYQIKLGVFPRWRTRLYQSGNGLEKRSFFNQSERNLDEMHSRSPDFRGTLRIAWTVSTRFLKYRGRIVVVCCGQGYAVVGLRKRWRRLETEVF